MTTNNHVVAVRREYQQAVARAKKVRRLQESIKKAVREGRDGDAATMLRKLWNIG